MADADLDQWLAAWCRRELGAAPAERLTPAQSGLAQVVGVRLEDSRAVFIKVRPDPTRRVITCVAAQRQVADSGFPCARPLTDVTYVDGLAVHAEQWRPDGVLLRGDSPEIAGRFARLFADLTAITARLQLPAPLPNPEWVRWEHDGPGHWPPNPRHDTRPGADDLPARLVEIAAAARARLLKATPLPRILGHADWETQNMRWTADGPHVVHDWDSIALLPEAALVGSASGGFASAEIPTLAPLRSSEAFIAAYEIARGREFSADERQLAWAASLWPALHNARAEFLWDQPAVALAEVLSQGEERLRRAGA